MSQDFKLDPASIRAKLAGTRGREYWKSLDELAGTPAFESMLRQDFPRQAAEWMDPVNRRSFLRLMGASFALAGLSGCVQQPLEKIVPYVRPPEELVPGKPLYFATSLQSPTGDALGVLVESHMGRPTKIEGNPDHPSSLGATDTYAQAAVLGLYDPDRSQTVTHNGQIDTWQGFLAAFLGAMGEQGAKRGAGLRVLTPPVTSPTLAWQAEQLLKTLPEARWHQYEPANQDSAHEGARLAFGEILRPVYRFDQAEVVVSIDADFLACHQGGVRYTRDFARKRRPTGHGDTTGNRLYALESSPTLTGAKADHKLPVKPALLEAMVFALARRLSVAAAGNPPDPAGGNVKWLDAVAKELTGAAGRSIVVAGSHLPPGVQALVHAINDKLGNAGKTLYYTRPLEAFPVPQVQSLRELLQAIGEGKVETLVILGGNPGFDAPADLGFAGALEKVKNRFRLGLYEDETSALCEWHAPETHFLEAWSDARGHDGTIGIVQPLIAPLYSGRSAHEIVAAMLGQAGKPGHDIVRDFWKSKQPGAGFEKWWQTALHDGLVKDSASPEVTPSNMLAPLPAPRPAGDDVELCLRPDPTIWDGRYANNGWLQELPKPLSMLTWDNSVQMSPAMAKRLGVSNGDIVSVTAGGRSASGPVWIMPGHADGCATIHFGYGRARTGRVGTGAGFDAYPLRASGALWTAGAVTIARTGASTKLATTQAHFSMEGRDLIRVIEPGHGEHRGHGDEAAKDTPHHNLSMYPEWKYDVYKWGMAIDLNACVGCSSCTVACQAENNIPVVGKTEVIKGREMHWIRVDRYYKGEEANPEVYHQPVPCMHCENAPCEVVCPVGATSHSEDGLNDMAYNRCVGTKYCSNNCPYKVRRFNFFQYSDYETESLKMLYNPDVTVRSLGVMEKCTYCVQRINAGRIDAEKENRKVRDGEVVTACQQACPAEAIVFGDLNDPNSKIAKLAAEKRNYGLLEEINTRPRTTYLATLRNPNKDLKDV